jgi:2-haloacid dehalogenase
LLSDLQVHTKIPFTHLLSAELFGTYKPSSAVYRGAAEKLGLPIKECVMVAAHLNDLRAAKSQGMQVVYVQRPGEEEWSDDEVNKARSEGWVDVWVSLREGNRGFVTVAEKLGVDPPVGHARKLSSSA